MLIANINSGCQSSALVHLRVALKGEGAVNIMDAALIVDFSELNDQTTPEVGSTWFATGCELCLFENRMGSNKFFSSLWMRGFLVVLQNRFNSVVFPALTRTKVAAFLTNIGGVEDVGHVNSGCGSAGAKITPLGIMQCGHMHLFPSIVHGNQ